MVKNCDRGLENAVLDHSFTPYGPTLSRQITYIYVFHTCDMARQPRDILDGQLKTTVLDFQSIVPFACSITLKPHPNLSSNCRLKPT